MKRIELSRQAASFLKGLPAKHARQVAEKLDLLAKEPEAAPSEMLKGYAPMRRLRAGEYRIIFVAEADFVRVRLIGKRNDDEIYKALAKLGRK
jgi:mRNA interferase RelE/StbE